MLRLKHPERRAAFEMCARQRPCVVETCSGEEVQVDRTGLGLCQADAALPAYGASIHCMLILYRRLAWLMLFLSIPAILLVVFEGSTVALADGGRGVLYAALDVVSSIGMVTVCLYTWRETTQFHITNADRYPKHEQFYIMLCGVVRLPSNTTQEQVAGAIRSKLASAEPGCLDIDQLCSTREMLLTDGVVFIGFNYRAAAELILEMSLDPLGCTSSDNCLARWCSNICRLCCWLPPQLTQQEPILINGIELWARAIADPRCVNWVKLRQASRGCTFSKCMTAAMSLVWGFMALLSYKFWTVASKNVETDSFRAYALYFCLVLLAAITTLVAVECCACIIRGCCFEGCGNQPYNSHLKQTPEFVVYLLCGIGLACTVNVLGGFTVGLVICDDSHCVLSYLTTSCLTISILQPVNVALLPPLLYALKAIGCHIACCMFGRPCCKHSSNTVFEATYELFEFDEALHWARLASLFGFPLYLGGLAPLLFPISAFGLVTTGLATRWSLEYYSRIPIHLGSAYLDRVMRVLPALLLVKYGWCISVSRNLYCLDQGCFSDQIPATSSACAFDVSWNGMQNITLFEDINKACYCGKDVVKFDGTKYNCDQSNANLVDGPEPGVYIWISLMSFVCVLLALTYYCGCTANWLERERRSIAAATRVNDGSTALQLSALPVDHLMTFAAVKAQAQADSDDEEHDGSDADLPYRAFDDQMALIE